MAPAGSRYRPGGAVDSLTTRLVARSKRWPGQQQRWVEGDARSLQGRGEGLSVVVDLVEELGADGYVYTHGESHGQRVELVARVSGGLYPRLGDALTLAVPPVRVHVFHAQTGERLNGAVGLAPGGPAQPAAAVG